MHNVEEAASREAVAERARQCTTRRIERFDILVALLLLLFLIVGWIKDFGPARWWAGTDLLAASGWPHAWSAGALR
jgi:hypothetical protein